ncbi:response regulator [Lysobacter sp. TY2-98]|uniref:response regulator n=1 Tax=Lysobacter sp. TY2-98 TaxID=2290922 RepID=UPI0013B364D7|nr:response regulator [Lysobacter sp. TY2-98]
METRILVVDDNARVREMLADLLELEGHVVYQAETGQVALQLLQGGLQPRLIVCDLMMPDVDGWQVLAAVEQMPERPDVIVFSSLGDLASVERLTERYGCTVLKKPEQLREVVGAARAHIERPH